MAKSKPETVTLETQLTPEQQEINRLKLEVAQLEQELRTLKQDPFASREGARVYNEKIYELVWSTLQIASHHAPGTARQIETLLPALVEFIGKERVWELELQFRGVKKK